MCIRDRYIEAQAAGLMTFGTAKVVPEEVDCTPLIHFIDSQSEDKLWAKQILENSLDYERKDKAKEIENCGFEISVAVSYTHLLCRHGKTFRSTPMTERNLKN